MWERKPGSPLWKPGGVLAGVSGPAKELSHGRAVQTGRGTLGLSGQRKCREVAFP